MTSYSCLPLKMIGKKCICPSGFVCVSCIGNREHTPHAPSAKTTVTQPFAFITTMFDSALCLKHRSTPCFLTKKAMLRIEDRCPFFYKDTRREWRQHVSCELYVLICSYTQAGRDHLQQMVVGMVQSRKLPLPYINLKHLQFRQ
jgi:hypothetical protein